MSDKNAFSSAAMPIAAASVIALIAAIGVGLWVGAPDKPAPAGPVATDTAGPLGATGTIAQPAPSPSTSTPDAPPQKDAAMADADATATDTAVADTSAAGTKAQPADVKPTTDVADGISPDGAASGAPVSSETPDDDTGGTDAVASATPTPTTPTPTTTAEAVPDGVALDGAPVTLDIVRIPPDGMTTVAGHAPADTDVVIYVDGVEVSRSTTNARGEFVALFDLMAADKVREMTVGVINDGKTTFAAASIVVAPAVAAVDQGAAAVADTQVAATAGTARQETAPTAPDAVTAAATSNDAANATADRTGTARVAATSAPMDQTPTVLKADNEGVKVIQQAGSDATTVRIDALTYDPDGRVFASGRAPNGAIMRLYLDTVLAAETRAGADGQWRVELKDVAAGVYTLRADQIGPDGKVVTRAETPFKREDIAILAQIAGQAGQDSNAIATGPDATREDTATADTASADATETTEAPTQVASGSGGEDGSAVHDGGTQDAAVQGAAVQAPPPASDPARTETAPPSRIASITVQPGNTLWGIASDRYGDGFLFARVFDANKAQIRDPDLIYPGQVFVLPQ